jgi:hypothetical protein
MITRIILPGIGLFLIVVLGLAFVTGFQTSHSLAPSASQEALQVSIEGTRSGLGFQMTRDWYEPTQYARQATQTMVVLNADIANLPLQLTATRAAEEKELEAQRFHATQTAINQDAQMNDDFRRATIRSINDEEQYRQTLIVRADQTEKDRATVELAKTLMIGAGVLFVCSAGSYFLVAAARSKKGAG